MSEPPSTNHTPPLGRRDRMAERARRRLATVRHRYEGSWAQDFIARLSSVDFGNAIVMFGASLLLSTLPLLILLSSAADERIDDDVSRHLGLNGRGAHIMEQLLRKTPTHSAGSIILGAIIAFLGTVTVAGSLQVIYERAFDQGHRGWRDLSRFVTWVLVLLGAVIVEGSTDIPLRRAIGAVGRDLVSFLGVTLFIWWTMHFLLAGRLRWSQLARAALVSGLLWLLFALFSSLYFSSALISEHRLYGTLGVVFILLTWFIAIGAVIVLGAVIGAVWEQRSAARWER